MLVHGADCKKSFIIPCSMGDKEWALPLSDCRRGGGLLREEKGKQMGVQEGEVYGFTALVGKYKKRELQRESFTSL